jgi:hypothetical protein
LHIAKIGWLEDANRALVGKKVVKVPLGRTRKRRKADIKVNIRDIGCEDGRWMKMAVF